MSRVSESHYSVTGTVNGLVNPTYTYDSVGNLTEEKTGTTIQREITWTGFNMPLKITKGVSTIEFLYDADNARVYEARKTGATFDSQTYFVNAGNSLFFEIETKGTITEWKHYLHAPSGLLMMRSIKSNTTAKTDVYFHKDHLGSITTITNNIGAILEQNSFDAFGKRRNSNGSDATTTINSLTRRGFTQHEMLPEVNLIHMNGRVYEPTLGRFMSADPNVQFAGYSQSYNRYSYTLNNPLSGIDPTGFGTWSDFRDNYLNPTSRSSPVNILNPNSIFNPAGRNSRWLGARENFRGAITGNLGQILMGRAHMMVPGLYSIDEFNSTHPRAARIATAAGQIACGFTTIFYAACSAGVSAYSTAVMGGGNSAILRSAAVAYISASLTSGINSYYGNTWTMSRVLVTSVAGGIATSLQGGSFADGFKTSFILAGLTFANMQMRAFMAEQARLNPGSNGDGLGVCFRGDCTKMAGGLYDAEFPDALSKLGGQQGSPDYYFFGHKLDTSTFLGRSMAMVMEAYAGPHDTFNSGYFYDGMGGIRTGMSAFERGFGEVAFNYSTSLVLATPFAAAALVPGNSYSAINALRNRY
jgi:RHS repeat-associated protein